MKMRFKRFRKNHVYLNKVKYLNYLLRSVCIITQIPSVSSKVQYSILEWIYTTMFYMFLCFIFYDLLYDKYLLRHHIDNPTMDSINFILVTSISICIVLLSPLLATRVHKIRKEYRKLWLEFQMEYERYTISEFNFGSSSFIISLALSGFVVTTLELAANCVLTSQTATTYMCAYWLIYFYTNFTTILWVVDCHLLTRASEISLDQFLATMSSDKPLGCGKEVRVSGYIELWQKLSDMTGTLINTGRGQYEFNFIAQSVIVIQAFYGIAALYVDHQQPTIQYNINIVYFPTAAWSILNLVVFCEAAYSVTTQVGFKTKVAIQSMACSRLSLETQEQIFTGLKTVESNRPEITVRGYFIVNRTFLINYLGVAISYIIVLVQFKIGTS